MLRWTDRLPNGWSHRSWRVGQLAGTVRVSARRFCGRRSHFSALGLCLVGTHIANASPTGGQIATGAGQISQSGSTTTVQTEQPGAVAQLAELQRRYAGDGEFRSAELELPWRSIASIVRRQRNSGHLNANGQVWLINPNGVLFGEHAQVNVGGLVASTLASWSADSSTDTRKFSGSGNGAVTNQGTINAATGGYVALLGHQVSNQGVISAQLGTVALGAGSAQTLTFSGNRLLHLQVDASQLGDLVENSKLHPG